MHSLLPVRHARLSAGFTLIDILVVIVIVAVVLSMGMLSVGLLGDDRDLKTEARRFSALYEVVRDEASLQGREFGIELMTAGYRFVEYDPFAARWADVPADEKLRQRGMPDEVELELFIEDRLISLEDNPSEFEDPEDNDRRASIDVYAPHLLVFSSGDATPFELHIWRRYDDQRVVLRGDALGQVEMVNPDEE